MIFPLGKRKKKYRDQALAKFVAGLKNTSSSPSPAKPPKPVVLMGDLNCARGPMDIYNPKKVKAAGYTPQERASFEKRIVGQAASPASAGLRDVWRERYPDLRGYTYWSYRGRCYPTNNGWRLDYALVHSELAGKGNGGGGTRADDSDGEEGGGSGGDEDEDEDDRGGEKSSKGLIHDVFHLPHVRGSDHCPIGLAISAEGHGEELV